LKSIPSTTLTKAVPGTLLFQAFRSYRFLSRPIRFPVTGSPICCPKKCLHCSLWLIVSEFADERTAESKQHGEHVAGEYFSIVFSRFAKFAYLKEGRSQSGHLTAQLAQSYTKVSCSAATDGIRISVSQEFSSRHLPHLVLLVCLRCLRLYFAKAITSALT
jgi:hypothetical protein